MHLTATPSLRPFDAHNHVHMQSASTHPSILWKNNDGCFLSGMALMSTHPRDYPQVVQLAHQEAPAGTTVVPGLGVHPWWLHELTQEDWEMVSTTNATSCPRWIRDLEAALNDIPGPKLVGECGLDKFHYNGDTGDLRSPMDVQVRAMEHQLDVATRLELPISIHCVHAIGPLMDCISKSKKIHKGSLPPAMYFHAFGGKPASVDQLAALCRSQKTNKTTTEIFFGFAPVINFRSPKTADVIRKVGLDRLVLETDHEDAQFVEASMREGLSYISNALGISERELVHRTNRNVERLYGIRLLEDDPLVNE